MVPAKADADTFRLVVTGGSFVDFEGDCRLVDERGFEAIARLAGGLPQAYAISAEAVACDLRKEDHNGSLTARLERNGKLVARASTRASFAEVSVRSEGPWGPARATVKVPPFLLRHGTPLRRPGLPPLNAPVVPPLSGQTVPPLR
jgi:hypothetical protein